MGLSVNQASLRLGSRAGLAPAFSVAATCATSGPRRRTGRRSHGSLPSAAEGAGVQLFRRQGFFGTEFSKTLHKHASTMRHVRSLLSRSSPPGSTPSSTSTRAPTGCSLGSAEALGRPTRDSQSRVSCSERLSQGRSPEYRFLCCNLL